MPEHDETMLDGHERPAAEWPDTSAPDPAEAALVPAKEQRPAHREMPARALPSRKGRWSKIVLLTMLATGLGSLVWWYWPSVREPSVRYKLATVDRGAVAATVTATGTLNPTVSVPVGSQVTGKVQHLYADFNSRVTEGQILARIDPAPFRAKRDQARASLRTARGTLAKAQVAVEQRKLDLDRAVTLRRQEFVSQSEVDSARTNYRDALAQLEVSQAQVEQAGAALVSAELDLEHTAIRSPVNGIVVSRNVEVGQTVAASLQAPTLFLIAQDLLHMQVNANVSESDIGGVTEGKQAEFLVDAYPGRTFKGTVTQVRNAPVSIQNVVTYDVIIDVDNHDLLLKPGMTANVAIVTAHKEEVLRVPNAALRFKLPGTPTERKKSVVWVLDATGPPRQVPIRTGVSDSMLTEVVEGDVREGDSVIVALETSPGTEGKELPPGFGGMPKMR